MIDTCGLFVGCLLTCSSDEDTLTVDLIAPETGTFTIEYYFLENVIRFEIPGTIGVAFEIPGQYFNEYGNARIKIVNPDGTYFTKTVDGVIYETFYLVVKQTVDANFIPASGGGGGVADNWGTQVVEIDATLVGDGTLATPLGVNTAVIATQTYADNAAAAAADDWGAQVVEIDATLSGDGTIGTPLGVDVSVIATRAYADGAALAAADGWGSDVVNHDTSLTGNGTAGTPLAVDTSIIATRAYADAAAAAVAYTDQEARDAVGAMVDASLNYVGGTPLLQRAALTGAITANAGSNATVLGSFTKAQLDAAVSDGNVLYVGDAGDILNGGNTTGAAISIGTNDAFDLNFETQGVERVNITGGATTGGAVRITNVTANTNTVQDVLTIRTNSSGTAAANFGGAILFQGESTTTDNQDMVRLSSIWTTATHATRAGALVLSQVSAGGALTESVRFTAAAMLIANTYTLGGNGNHLIVGGSNGHVTVSGTDTIGILLTAGSATTGRVRIGTTAFTSVTLAKEAMDFTDTYTAASGTGTFTAIAIDNTINLTGTASGVQRGIDINPTLTSLTAATYRGIDIQYSNAAAYGIYQSGALTKNIFVGLTSHGMTTDPVGAFIDIAAGTTTNAQINLTPGVAKTTPLAGDVYNVNNNTYASTGAVTFGVGGVIFDNFADATVGGAVADIYTYTTPASTFGNNGDKVIASYSGNFVTVGTEIVQLKVLFAGTTIWDSTGIAVTTGTTSWRVGVELIRVSSTVVRYSVYLSTTGASGFIYVTVGELTALTLSNTNILKITGESSGVGSGAGDIVGKMAYGEFKPAR